MDDLEFDVDEQLNFGINMNVRQNAGSVTQPGM